MAAIGTLRPMLASLAGDLPTSLGWLYESKWDGFRAITIINGDGTATVYSRRGTNLTDAFPDIAAAAARLLPAGTVVDGEIVRWGTDGRLDFEALQRRNRGAGRSARDLARTEPCHLIVFDILHTAAEGNVTGRPLIERRQLVEQYLDGQDQAAVVVAGMQTDDLDTARMWLDALAAIGVEGIVAKRAQGTYRPGARGWSKIKNYTTTEVIIGGITGTAARPESLIVGRIHTADGQLHIAGRTTDLSPAAAEQIAELIVPAGDDHPWPEVLPPSWHDRESRPYVRVVPQLVAEIRVDVATSHSTDSDQAGQWRHRLRFLRLRPDQDIEDVPTDLELES